MRLLILASHTLNPMPLVLVGKEMTGHSLLIRDLAP